MQQFENPIVETKHSLTLQYKDYMKQNKDILVIDLGENIPIYSHYINKKVNIEHYAAKTYLNKHLTNITNAYKQFDTRIIERMLIEEANKIKMLAKGSVITDEYITYCIENAIINNDTIEVKSNSTLRFLTNPYYTFKNKEQGDDRIAEYKLRNKLIGDVKTRATYELIHNCITDFDCSLGNITKKKLKDSSKLSARTISNYLKTYTELNELFTMVKELSSTDKQLTKKRYNDNSKAA